MTTRERILAYLAAAIAGLLMAYAIKTDNEGLTPTQVRQHP